MQSYTLGETIRIELSLRDKTGIGDIAAVFNRSPTFTRPSACSIVMNANGGNRVEARVELKTQITNQTAPGEYVCEYIQVTDTLGNQVSYHPDIRFRIENIPGDHEGPELLDWEFIGS